jgi:hypothetical protein
MTAGTTSRRASVPVLFAGSAVLAAVAGGLILRGDRVAAGYAAAASGAAVVAGGMLWHRWRNPLDRILDSTADRLFDALVLSAIAWRTRQGDPGLSAAALVALGAGFLGAYIRAKGEALGYQVEESMVTRGLRYGLVAAGLISGRVEGTVYAAGAVAAIAALVRTTQVAKEERA